MNLKSFKIILLSLVLVVSIGFSLKASADNGVYKIDFGYIDTVNPTSGQYWNMWPNSLATPYTATTSLIDSLGATSSVKMYFADAPTCGVGETLAMGNGAPAITTTGYAPNATNDYVYDGLGGCSGNFQSTLVFNGLNPAYTYNVKFFSSRTTSGSRVTKMTIGNASTTLEAVNNSANTAQISNITPSATSSIAATFSSGSAGQYYYLNVVELIANTPNIPPVVNAGTDITITSPTNSVTLNSTVTDADGTISSTAWSLFGDAYATFASSTATSTLVTGLYPGKYTFRMTAADNNGSVVYDDVDVTVLPAGFTPASKAKKIVVIGSTIAAGTGSIPSGTYENSWVRLFEKYLKLYNASSSVSNLAVGGYTTNKALPTGSGPEDPAANITAALAQNPDAIIFSFTTNDANFAFPIASSSEYIRTVVQTATASSVPIWVTTTSGRSLSALGLTLLVGYSNAVLTEYGTSTSNNAYRGIDIFSRLANPDGTIKSPFGDSYLGFVQDNVHVNNYGHSEIFRAMVESNFASTLSATTSNAPSSLSSSVSGTSASLSWSVPSPIDPVVPPTQYNIYDANTNILVATTTSTTTGYGILGLVKGNTYSYYITATNFAGQSASSTAVTFTVPLDSTAITSVSAPASTWTPGSSSAGSSGIPSSLLPFISSPATPASAGQSNAGGVSTSITSASFSRSLSAGMTGFDVKALQQYLNAKGFVVAPSGAGSKGKETSLFGPATKAALIRFQKAMKISPAVGFFGQVTRAAIR